MENGKNDERRKLPPGFIVFMVICGFIGPFLGGINSKLNDKIKLSYSNIQSDLNEEEIPNRKDVLDFLSNSYKESGTLDCKKILKHIKEKTSFTVDGITLDSDLSFFWKMQKKYSHKRTKEKIKNYLLLLQINRLKEKLLENLEQPLKKGASKNEQS